MENLLLHVFGEIAKRLWPWLELSIEVTRVLQHPGARFNREKILPKILLNILLNYQLDKEIYVQTSDFLPQLFGRILGSIFSNIFGRIFLSIESGPR